MVTEDGFNLANFFNADPKKVHWPKLAVPGADMTNAQMPDVPCDAVLTQGADGKLYLQTGHSAYWNLEIAGLDKVKALPGGKITVPAAK